MNGYTLTGLTTIGQPGDSAGKESLRLSPIPAVSAMVLSSLTRTRKAVQGTQNSTAEMPQALGVWLAGSVTPKIGVFSQFTYEAASGSFGIDMIDIRYADHGTLAGHDLLYGLTLHNNPTLQDVWNTVPSWAFPFVGSSTAPSPIASTLIDGTLAQQVVGLGAYSLYNNLLYTEFTVYRSAPQGIALPLDSSARNTAANVIPYWRVAWQHETPTTSLMLGTFGFDAHLYPEGVSGLLNRYSDIAVDAQVEQRHGGATLIGRASIIHERQQLLATRSSGGADNAAQRLTSARINVAYLPSTRYSFTIGYFQTTGTTDTTLYAPQSLVGSRFGRPNTEGEIGEINFNPWQNARVGMQYLTYSKFNGAWSAYDVAGGRSAADNNTLYLYLFLAF
ncbi:MAG: cytochrome C [Gemmatimonadota bacterium]|nr:cytochrome C [Gemmatimonadota bacterium]